MIHNDGKTNPYILKIAKEMLYANAIRRNVSIAWLFLTYMS